MYFDSVIGNPPYEGRGFLYTRILYTTWNNSKSVSWLCPTTFVDGVYKRNDDGKRAFMRFIDYVNNK